MTCHTGRTAGRVVGRYSRRCGRLLILVSTTCCLAHSRERQRQKGNSHVGLLMAMRCWTGVVKSRGIGGYVAPAATPKASKGSPLTKVRRLSIMMTVVPTLVPVSDELDHV